MGFAPTERRRNEDWALYYEDVPVGLSVRRAAINFGAPGDRRDEDGRLWFGFPRQLAVGTHQVAAAPLQLDFDPDFGLYRADSDSTAISGTDRPWVYASGVKGVRRLTFDLSYYNPLYSCLSVPCDRAPVLDGRLDEDLWDGSRRIELADGRGSAFLRHDADNLYVGYEQRVEVDRFGRRRPWKTVASGSDASIWEDDCLDLRLGSDRAVKGNIARFGVSASGARYDSRWEPTFDIPRLGGISVDGRAEDWQDEGLRVDVVPGVRCRMAWDDGGLLLLLSREAEDGGEAIPVTDISFIAAKPGSSDYARLAVDLTRWVCAGRRRVGGVESEGGVEYVQAEAGEAQVVEARIPWENVGVRPVLGAEVGLPLWCCFDNTSFWRQQDERLRQSFLNDATWRTVSRLRLAADADRPTVVALPGRRDFPNVAHLSRQEDAGWNPGWRSAVRLSDRTFATELAIPWQCIEDAGLARDDLKIDFGATGPLEGVPDYPWRHRLFDQLARNLRLEGSGEGPKRYTVRLHFAELDDVRADSRVFDVFVQGREAIRGVDVVRDAGGARRANIRECRGVLADRILAITFQSAVGQLTSANAPILSGVEIEEERDG
jgi:hypothetical protein